ncbi:MULTISPECIES: C39 family peptidase [unclassified Rhodococcus (in: high G+C Gram-positive bacteria)]|uniref:C39 family peptidase n=1 Tax=unclassified Rhodococcus (in: high G+C Gram-positive bacteria) TaxID=192944 RepID=UPI003396E360
MDDSFSAAHYDVIDEPTAYDDESELLGDAIALEPMPTMPLMIETGAAPDTDVSMPLMPSMTAPDPYLTVPVSPAPELAPAPPTPDLDLDLDLDPSEPEALPDPADGTQGTPAAWTADWFYQEFDGACGPSSVAQIVSEYTGLDISDPSQLIDRALELGLFVDGDPSTGMTSQSIEILMEDQGVPCHLEYSSIEDLKVKLGDGYGVIAMVDSGEIWYPGEEVVEDDRPDHALVIAGIDETRGVVILSDPGTPNGNQLEVPIEQFADAWADSGYEMLVADAPDPDLADDSVDPSVAALVGRAWAIITLT